MPEKFTVEIDSEVESIVPEFLDGRRRDCLLINSLLVTGEYTRIRTLGHRMKGAGGSYGFDGISEIGEIIEHAAEAGDGGTITVAVAKLTDYLERVVPVYI